MAISNQRFYALGNFVSDWAAAVLELFVFNETFKDIFVVRVDFRAKQ